jgi:hypothetical protein
MQYKLITVSEIAHTLPKHMDTDFSQTTVHVVIRWGGGRSWGGGEGEGEITGLFNTDGHCIRRQELHNAQGAHFPVSYPCDKHTNNLPIFKRKKLSYLVIGIKNTR